jgi:hypothetical protein
MGAKTFYMSQYQNKSLIKRVKRNTNFTHLSNEVFNSSLSPDALGVLCYILHLPDDWVIHKTHLQKVFNVGRERMDRIFKDIEASGFLISMDMVRVEGKFVGKNYFFYDTPQTQPLSEKPFTAKPTTVNTQLLNTNKLNTNNTKTPNPLKGEKVNDINIEHQFTLNDWIDAYKRVYERAGKKMTDSDIDKPKVKKLFDRWVDNGRDPQKPLHALMGVLSDNWQRERNYPNAKLSSIFNTETVSRFAK